MREMPFQSDCEYETKEKLGILWRDRTKRYFSLWERASN